MKKPQEVWAPHKFNYFHEYTYEGMLNIELIHPDGFSSSRLDDHIEFWKDQNDWKEGDPIPEFKEFWYDNEMCTLEDLINKVPADVPFSDVVIKVTRDRQMSSIGFIVKARRPTDKEAQTAAYNKAYKEYEEKLEQYSKDMVIYNLWKAEEDIKKKQEEISDLQKQLGTLKK